MKCAKWSPETGLCTLQSMDKERLDENDVPKVYKGTCADPEHYETCNRLRMFRDAARIGTGKVREAVIETMKTPMGPVIIRAVPAKLRHHATLEEGRKEPKAKKVPKAGLKPLDAFKKEGDA